MKHHIWRAIITIICIWIILFMSGKIKTYNSALDNTADNSIFIIDQNKNTIKQAKARINTECKRLGNNKPHRFVKDWTCE